MDENNVIFFKSGAEFRDWLKKNHDTAPEIWMGYFKKSSNIASITYSEALDEALCFGWIDGIRKKVDDKSYKQRYTPRRKGSNWSEINIKKVEELKKAGLMQPAGLEAFNRRDRDKGSKYSYEDRKKGLGKEYVTIFRKHPKAWDFYCSQPPSYRNTSAFWVMSAKREETRQKRLNTLIEDSKNGLRIDLLRR